MKNKSRKNWSIQISTELRDILRKHCKSNGLKMNSFVETTIKDKVSSSNLDTCDKIIDIISDYDIKSETIRFNNFLRVDGFIKNSDGSYPTFIFKNSPNVTLWVSRNNTLNIFPDFIVGDILLHEEHNGGVLSFSSKTYHVRNHKILNTKEGDLQS